MQDFSTGSLVLGGKERKLTFREDLRRIIMGDKGRGYVNPYSHFNCQQLGISRNDSPDKLLVELIHGGGEKSEK